MELKAVACRLHFDFPACFSCSSFTGRRANNMPAIERTIVFELSTGWLSRKPYTQVGDMSGF